MSTVESGWVIEHRSSDPSHPLYWKGNGWSHNHLDAIRFARKIDAERTAKGFDEDDALQTDAEHRCCEHEWGS